MPATKQAPAAKRDSSTKQAPAAKQTGTTREARGAAALDGLEVSLDDAQKAIAELRRDLSTGGRKLVKDVEIAIKNARRDLGRTRKAIQHDLGELGGALTPHRTAQRATKPKPDAKPKSAAEPKARTTAR